MVLYLAFGMLNTACLGELSCGVYFLSFQVVRILIIFAVLILLNATITVQQHAQGRNGWAQLSADLARLRALRELRLQLICVYLALPLACLFVEVRVLDWRGEWFGVLWEAALDTYLAAAVGWSFRPSARTYATHFAWVRPSPNAELAAGAYPAFFRWLLGARIDYAAADAAVAANADVAAARREERRD